MTRVETYFAVRGVGERYALGRPYFHPLVVERLGERADTFLFGTGLR